MAGKRLRFALIIDYLVSDYSETIAQGVTDFCDENNVELYTIPIGIFHSPRQTFIYQNLSVASHIKKNNFDGVIMACGSQIVNSSAEYIENFINSMKPLPVVTVSHVVQGCPSLIVNATSGFSALVNHLIQAHGCRKFALMGVKGQSSEGLERTAAFKNTLLKNGISLDTVTFWEANYEYNSASRILDEYIAKGGKFNFDAIVCLNDEMAFACIDTVKRMGKRVPDDIKITGFDDIPRARFTNPGLSTVTQQLYPQGFKAAKVLLQKIRGEEVPEVMEFSSKALVRCSCGCTEETGSLIKGRNIHFDSIKSIKNNFDLASEWYVKRFHILQATAFYTNANLAQTLQELKIGLNTAIKKFEIKACAIVLYNNPVVVEEPFDHFSFPKDAYVFSAFDMKRNYDNGNEDIDAVFDPNKELLPEGIIEYEKGGFIIYPIYHYSKQFGYIVYSRGSFDISAYDLFGRTVATLVDSATTFTQRKNETDRYADQSRLMDVMANTDELTGLRNRRGFLKLAEQSMALNESMQQSGLVLFCDMDGLKKINDTYGHESGDVAIKAEADILKKCFRSSDIIGRIGGDEFAVICSGMSEKDLQKIRKNIDKACDDWRKRTKSKFKLSVSIGCEAFPSKDAGYKTRVLLSEADAALYIEKQEKRKKTSAVKKLI